MTVLYYTIVYPYLQYCNVALGMANVTTIKPLQLLQKIISLTKKKMKHEYHTAPLFKDFKDPKIKNIHSLDCLGFIPRTITHTSFC